MAVFATSISGSGQRATLTNGEDVYVAAGVTVGSDNGSAILSATGTSSYHNAIIAGNVVAQIHGIFLGYQGTDAGQSLTIRAGAELIGFDGYAAAIFGHTSTANNAGSIFGGYGGLNMVSNTGGASSLTNTGSIEGGFYGIYSSNASGQTLAVTNSGTIKSSNADGYAFFEQGASPDKITNDGQVTGTVSLGNGADTYDGRKGHVKGVVYGNGGDDRLYGGTENNTLHGGADNDRLFGGGGNDTLTGDIGNDRFYFTADLKSAGIDKVTDFSNKNGEDDRIYLDDAVFKALGASVTSGEFLKVSSGHSAKQSDDHLIYNTKDGSLWYDADGSGKGAAVHIATLTNKADISFHDFFIA